MKNKIYKILCLLAFIFISCDLGVTTENNIIGHWGLVSIDGIIFKELEGYQSNSLYFNKDRTVSLPYKDYFERERNAIWSMTKKSPESLLLKIKSNKDEIFDNTFKFIWLDQENFVVKLISDDNVIIIQKINTFSDTNR